MPPKRKSDVLVDTDVIENIATSSAEPAGPSTKKARVSDETQAEASASKGKGKKAKDDAPKKWQDVELEGEDEKEVPVYDDCNDVRRKIRALQKTPGFKVTHWLKEIGNINSNSLTRFMKATGPTGGATNGVYYAAYVYFEKVRIAEGKKKTPKRERTESTDPNGLPLEDRRRMWVFGPA